MTSDIITMSMPKTVCLISPTTTTTNRPNNNQNTEFVSACCPSQQKGNTLLLVTGPVCDMGAGRVAHAGDEVEAAAATGDFGKRNNGDDEINAVATVAAVVAAKGVAAAAKNSSNEELAQILSENDNTDNQPTVYHAITPKSAQIMSPAKKTS